jgi:hypothetical protein
MSSFRRRVGDVYVQATLGDDGQWRADVTDAFSNPVSDDVRREAMKSVLDELSSLRHYIWRVELGHDD